MECGVKGVNPRGTGSWYKSGNGGAVEFSWCMAWKTPRSDDNKAYERRRLQSPNLSYQDKEIDPSPMFAGPWESGWVGLKGSLFQQGGRQH